MTTDSGGQGEDYAEAVKANYDRSDLGAAILAGLRAGGKDDLNLSPGDLVGIDHFHIGGRQATLDLMERADLRPGMDVLDLGGGLGGPARALASEAGCSVTVLDLTESYIRIGRMLTERTGLGERVQFRHGDATAIPFPDASFDVVWTQHSCMNIEDKAALCAEARRVLRPAGRFVFHEILAGSIQPIHYPVPWANVPAISFLRPPQAIRALLTQTGFRELGWEDLTAWSADWWRRFPGAMDFGALPSLGVHLIFGADTKTVIHNLMRNLDENRVAVARGVFQRE